MQFSSHDYRWGGDYLQRLLPAKRAVVENRDRIDPYTYLVLSAFARGVNQYIAEHRSQIPEWIDPITPDRRELKQFWFSPQQISDHTESVCGDRRRLGRHFRLWTAGTRRFMS
jgi:hypothetical protein